MCFSFSIKIGVCMQSIGQVKKKLLIRIKIGLRVFKAFAKFKKLLISLIVLYNIVKHYYKCVFLSGQRSVYVCKAFAKFTELFNRIKINLRVFKAFAKFKKLLIRIKIGLRVFKAFAKFKKLLIRMKFGISLQRLRNF
ncbi:hypothetical protein CHUAL_013225 [Chamberlinius hualienensis]